MKSLIAGLVLVAALSGAGGVVFAQDPDPLPAPANLRAVNGANPGEVNLTWGAVPEASFYRIGWVAKPDYDATVAAGRDWLEAFHFVDVANAGQAQWTLTRLSPGVQYYFIAGSSSKRFGGAAWSAWSDLLTLTKVPMVQVDYRSQYPNCDAVREHYPGGVKRGSPIYRASLDQDGDEIACEPAASVPTGNYLPVHKSGTFTGAGNNSDNILNLQVGSYRIITTRPDDKDYKRDHDIRVHLVPLSGASKKWVHTLYAWSSLSDDFAETDVVKIFADDEAGSRDPIAGDYILEMRARTGDRWTITIDRIGG